MGWAVGGGDFCLVLSQNPHVGTQRSILGDSRPPALSNWDSLGLEGEGKLGTWDKLWTRSPHSCYATRLVFFWPQDNSKKEQTIA